MQNFDLFEIAALRIYVPTPRILGLFYTTHLHICYNTETMDQQDGAQAIETLSLPAGRYNIPRNFPIVSLLQDSRSVLTLCIDPGFGDFRWYSRRFDTKYGWKKRLVHDIYCPKGIYFSPTTGRKVRILSISGIASFINMHNLYDPLFNPGSNRII